MMNLLPILLQAISRWQIAAEYSSMNIQPDIGCKGNYRCICGAHTWSDALRIWDGVTPGRPRNFAAKTDIGYIHSANRPPDFGMTFGQWDAPNAVFAMAHEV